MLNIFLLLSVAIDDQISPKKPVLVGNSRSGIALNLNDAERSVSKNDSKTSSASTTIRNLVPPLELLPELNKNIRCKVQIWLI